MPTSPLSPLSARRPYSILYIIRSLNLYKKIIVQKSNKNTKNNSLNVKLKPKSTKNKKNGKGKKEKKKKQV